MTEWTEPVFDRTKADVDYAKQQLAIGINNEYLKGCVNVTDITRIERNTDYLKEILTSLSYMPKTDAKYWKDTNIPRQNHIDRIINNVAEFWRAYYKPSDAVDLPNTLLHYEQINAIERNHYLIKEMIDDMISIFRECGTFECGEEY